jgi:hypothetical protein
MTERLTDDQIREAFRRSQGQCQCDECTSGGPPAALWANGPTGRFPIVIDSNLAAEHLRTTASGLDCLVANAAIPFVEIEFENAEAVRFFRIADLDAFLDDLEGEEAFG